jgi:hypothetical protein
MITAARIAAAALALLASAAPARSSDHLYVWAMETRDPSTAMPPAASMGRDFLAVFDVRPGSASFGKLIAMLAVGERGQMAHHINYDMPSDGRLFASDYMAGKAYVFDLRQPERPRLAASFGDAGPYTHAHSFDRLANGDTLATYQFKGSADKVPGALVELDASGKVVRASDASDGLDPFIRPYSVVAVPKLDRVVTTSADMMPSDHPSHVIQVWRLSDLQLLKTVVLERPSHYAGVVDKSASEARLLGDGTTVLVNTSGCGLYKINGLASSDPTANLVYDFGYRSCGVPTVVGHYWVQTDMSGHALTSLDVADPSHPREAGHLVLDSGALPHWIAREPDGNRLVITGFGSLATHARFATIDRATGALALDPRQIDFDRAWPDGWKGPAMPHGAVFGR